MTFVAQPFKEIADDLLTALTGGVIREEHLFVSAEEPYSLAHAGAIGSTVKVCGQTGGKFVVFTRDVDFTYGGEDGEVIKWINNGRLPDKQSHFYVNYYLMDSHPRLTDRNPGSVVSTLAEAFAREFAVLNKQMELIYRSAFVDLATGISLDHVASLLCIDRKDSRFASGEVLFKRTTPATGDITIPAGTLVSTADGRDFETTSRSTLRKGQLSVISPIRARMEGPDGSAEVGKIGNINRPIFGIETVINEKATAFASEKESDTELRRRIKGTLERAGKSTLDAIKFGLIEDVRQIKETNIQVVDRPGERGVVDVKLGLLPEKDVSESEMPDFVSRVEEAIRRYRPAGVRVVHNLPTRTQTESEERARANEPDVVEGERAAVAPVERTRQEPKHLAAEDLGEMPEDVLRLGADIFLRLNEDNLSVSRKQEILNTVEDDVAGYINDLPMGSDIIYNKILGLIVKSQEVVDASLRLLIISGKTVVRQEAYSNLATDGRKAAAKQEDVTAGLMEQTVFLDVLFRLEPKKGTNHTGITQQLKADAEAAIDRAITRSQESLGRAAIKEEAEALFDNSDLQFAEHNPVTLNAEFEETGLNLNNAEEVTVQEHQVLRLRDLHLEELGDLDA
jgi:hypothetical protein